MPSRDESRPRRRRESSAGQDRSRDERHRSSDARRGRPDSAPQSPSTPSTQALSLDALAQLNRLNAQQASRSRDAPRDRARRDRTRDRARDRDRDRDEDGERDREREERRERRRAREQQGGEDRGREGGERDRERRRDRTRDRTRTRPRSGDAAENPDRERGADSDRDQRRLERQRKRDKDREKERGAAARERPMAPDEAEALQPRRRVVSKEAAANRDGEAGYTPTLKPTRRERSKGAYRVLGGEDGDLGQQYGGDKKRKSRAVSGAVMEEGRSSGAKLKPPKQKAYGMGGYDSSYNSIEKEKELMGMIPPKGPPKTGRKCPPDWKNNKKLWILVGAGIAILIIIIALAVSLSKKSSSSSSSSGGSGASNTQVAGVPAGAPSWLNPNVWYDQTGFNLTYTNATVGDLPVMGLYSAWDDSAAANSKAPALDADWGSYAHRPARGVNLGGWLSLEPFITPSLFAYDASMGIIDEYTLCTLLGSSCERTLEKHYATFVTEATFHEIAAAGLDHVRIPYSYWAVQTYAGDPYVFRTSWRYLLRAIEWARKYGLRVNLDLHALPGSQNGWNHSGRQGAIGWFNGSDGALNANRSLDVHDRLSRFFAQPRYRNIIAFYGLANEPRMTFLSTSDVLGWTEAAYDRVRANGLTRAYVVFGDGFRGLAAWQGELAGRDGLVLDVHQYVIFNNDQVVYNHSGKINYACGGWTQQTELSMDTARGFGPTLTAEWSMPDTDCARHLTNVGWGNRWLGTYASGNATTEALTPLCPTRNTQCECDSANAPASAWTDEYKTFLLRFSEAQMYSFETGWGWFYWVWDTEDAPQWSYKQGLAAGVLPSKAYDRSWDCSQDIPVFTNLPEYY